MKKRDNEAKLGISRQFQYVKMEHKRYFCLQQNPFVLALVLFIGKNTLLPTIRTSLKKWSLQWIISEIRRYYYLFRANLSILIRFVRYKYNIHNIDTILELPFYGQVCVLVNKGYKILDIRRRVVIKVFRNDVDISTITDEMDCLKRGNLFDFGSTIRRWSIQERWYEEDYISGSLDYSPKPGDSSVLLEKFYKDIIPCLESLTLHQSPMMRNTIDYVDKIKSVLVVGNLQREGLDAKKILDFIHSIDERLHSIGNLPIFLVLTHGDFCPANMLNSKHRLRVLDWESATYRSALFDFYSYFFFRVVHQGLPHDKLSPEINAALPFFISKLDLKAPGISENVKSFENVYRWVYYVERVCMLVKREKTDTKLNIKKVILEFIDAFNSYEKKLFNDDI